MIYLRLFWTVVLIFLVDGDRDFDSNCNGIWGVNKTSGVPFEEELCGGSGQRGIIYIGDSVGAHFHAPPKWFTPRLLSPGILEVQVYRTVIQFIDVGSSSIYLNDSNMN